MQMTFRKGLAALAAATVISATAAQAETHEVVILDGGYFPQKLYMNQGDTIRFVNETIGIHRIEGLSFAYIEGEDDVPGLVETLAVTEGDLGDGVTQQIVVGPNKTVLIAISDNSGLVYSGHWPTSVDESVVSLPTGLIDGEVSYDEPPLDQDPDQLDIEYIN